MTNTSSNFVSSNSISRAKRFALLNVSLLALICSLFGVSNAQAQLLDYEDFYSQPSYSVSKSEDLAYGVGSTNYYLFNGVGDKSKRSDYKRVTRKTLTLDLYQPNTGRSNGKRAVIILVPGSGRNGCITANTCDVDTIREPKISTSDAHYISQEGDNYNELNDRGNRAINFAKRGIVVVSPVTRYQYQNRQQDKASAFRWKDDNGAALFNGLSTHMEPLVVDLKRVVRWLSNPVNANKYNVDPNNIYILGSSGASKMASLAAITATDKLLADDPAQLNGGHPDHNFEVNNNNLNVPQRPLRGAILFAGDTNGTRHLKLMNSESADFMFWHGTTDRAILQGMAETIEEKCESVGCISQFYSLPGVEHKRTASGKAVHTNADESVGFTAHVYDFMVNQLQRSGSDNRPTIGISSQITQFNERDGVAKIEVKLNKPAPNDIRFTMSADQMREVTKVNGVQGRYNLIQQYVANDGNSTGPVMYDQSTGVAYELRSNLPASYKNLDKHTRGPGQGNPVVIPQNSDYFYSDFSGKKQRMKIAKGQTKAVFNVDIVNDSLSEQHECFKVRLLNAQGARMTNTVETVVIRDDDNPNASSSPACANGNSTTSQNPVVSVKNTTANEGDGTVRVEFSVNGSLEEDVTVNYRTRNDSADSSDYDAKQGSLRIPRSSSRVTTPITIVDDVKVEGNERFLVEITSVSGSSAEIGTRSANVQIIDNDASSAPPANPVISINQDVFIRESRGVTNIRLTADQPLTEDVTISYRTNDGSARAGSGDYRSEQGQIVIAAGRSRDSIPIDILDDSLGEPNENFSVQLLSVVSGNATLGAKRATVTIIDDDDNSVATLSVKDYYVNESSGVMNVVVRASQSLREDIVFAFSTPGGTANATDGDYANRSERATISAGRDRVTLSIRILNDGRAEDNEFFSVNLDRIISGSAEIGAGSAKITIIDDD